MRKGFTLPEILVSIGILTVLFSIATFSLLKSYRSFTRAAFVDTLLTDLRDQQNKAMSQDTQGEAVSSDYGVYLSNDSYILFRGSSYDADDPGNFQIGLNPGLEIVNVSLPGNSVIFESGSGEVSGFAGGSDSFEIDDTTSGEVTTISLNRYGIPLE